MPGTENLILVHECSRDLWTIQSRELYFKPICKVKIYKGNPTNEQKLEKFCLLFIICLLCVPSMDKNTVFQKN